LLASSVAFAQTAPVDCTGHDATVCGRLHFQAGTVAFEKADYHGATAEFQAALEQRPHPVIRFNLALSLAKLGQPSVAIEHLRQVIADPTTDKELRVRAAREQKSAEQAQARVTFRLSDPNREQIELDGKLLTGPLTGELAIDPGMHQVKVISGSSVVLDQELELAPGERVELRVGERSRRIDVVVVPPDQPAVAKPSPATKAPTPVVTQTTRKLSPLWFYSAAGATLVLTGVTVWSGLDTQRAFSDYERDLPRLTQAQADARVSDGHSLELRTNLLLGGALLAGAGTAVLGIWFTDFGASARVGVAPGRVALSGRF
jgi:hypothetical protein